MKKILIISTGGTFNKRYNALNGELEIDVSNQALNSLSKQWMVDFTVINIIGKDSLDMNDDDRELIVKTIQNSSFERVIVIHGTDTMDKTAKYLSDYNLNKKIILTGAMLPFSIDSIEATANFSSAYGYISAIEMEGVYISMNGTLDSFDRVVKNREKGFFEVN